MQLIVALFFLQLIPVRVYGLINIKIIEDYFNGQSKPNGIVLGCFRKSEHIALAKKLINGTQSILNINDPKTEEKLNTTEQTVIILDGDCLRLETFLQKCGKNKYFNRKYKWLIISSSINLIKKIENVTLNIDTDIKILIPSETGDNKIINWTIIDVYNAASEHGGQLNYTAIGYYNENKGFSIEIQQPKYLLRKNMTGITFKTKVVLPVAFEGPLNDYLLSDDHRQINTFNRFHCRLILFCRDYYNFSLNISVENSWGYTNVNGKFDGMVGALDSKTIDFGCSPLFIRNDRELVIDYGVNTWIFRSAFIFRNPKSLSSFDVFIKPLSFSVWMISLMFAVLSILILKLATTYESNNFHSDIETSWSSSVIFTISAICQQGFPTTPKLYGGRIITISIFLLFLIIYQFYAGSVVSHLLFKSPTLIKTVQDLLGSSLKVGCEDTLYNRDYFLHTPDEAAQHLYYNKIWRKNNNSNFLSPPQGLELVEKGNYAFHVELAAAYPLVEETFTDKAICELREINLFRTQPMNANLQKNSPFRDMLNICLLHMSENGILSRERKFWHPRRPNCIHPSGTVLVNVGLNEFYPALLILLFGMILSLIVLIIERWIKFIENKNKKSRKRVVWPFAE